MPSEFRPRISQAKDLFPVIRAHLAAAAALHSLPAGLSLDLLPIVEDGLAGYEILPNRSTYTYLTIGWDQRGKPVVRESSYLDGPPSILRVVSVEGQTVPLADSGALHRLRQRDSVHPDWPTAAEAVWSELARVFPQQPRCGVEVHDARYEELDEALTTAYQHLADCDPYIDFCGVPNEAQYGFALMDARGGHGQLSARHPEVWSLWFQSAVGTVQEEWPMMPAGIDGTDGWVCASRASLVTPAPVAHAPALAAVSQRGRLRDREGDRRSEDRRHADRRHTARNYDERRQGDRRQNDRRLPRFSNAPV
jgi:hypothetical protein